jgi:hypothetical protein
LDPTAQERVLDYLREILEEGLNLDVSGDPLLERLSVQLPCSQLLPGVAQLVQSLGLTRVTLHGLSGTATQGTGTNASTRSHIADSNVGWGPMLVNSGGGGDNYQMLVASAEDAEVKQVLSTVRQS